MSEKYEDINATLAYLFNRAMAERPELVDGVPDDAVVVMQLEGYEAFNRWARETSLQRERDEGQDVVYAVFKIKPELAPRQITSRRIASSEVENLELQAA